MSNLFVVAVFGALGAVCRYQSSLWCRSLFGTKFTWGTLLVNVVGCFFLAFFMSLWQTESLKLPAKFHTAVTVGFFGALTTFSAFGYETITYLEKQEWFLAGLNITGNLLLGLLAAWIGLFIAKQYVG